MRVWRNHTHKEHSCKRLSLIIWGRTDGGGVGGHGVHLSPRIHRKYIFRHRSACRTPAESGQECLTRGKEYIEPHKLGRMKGLGGERGMLVGLDLPLVGGGTEAGFRCPRWGNCLSQRGNF